MNSDSPGILTCQLPIASYLVVAADVLSHDLDLEAGGLVGVMKWPQLVEQKAHEEKDRRRYKSSLTPSEVFGIPTATAILGEVDQRERWCIALHSLGFRFEVDDSAKVQAHEFRDRLHRWQRRFLLWVEAFTFQCPLNSLDIDAHYPRKGVVHIQAAGGSTKTARDSGLGIKTTVQVAEASLVSAAAQLASDETDMSQEWRLLVSAARLLSSLDTDNRSAVIYAALVAELALSKVVSSRLNSINPSTQDLLSKMGRKLEFTLNPLSRGAEIVTPGTVPSDFKRKVVELRNRVIHGGYTPTEREASEALNSVIKVLEAVDPLPASLAGLPSPPLFKFMEMVRPPADFEG